MKKLQVPLFFSHPWDFHRIPGWPDCHGNPCSTCTWENLPKISEMAFILWPWKTVRQPGKTIGYFSWGMVGSLLQTWLFLKKNRSKGRRKIILWPVLPNSVLSLNWFKQGPYKFQLQTTRSFVEQYYCWPFLGLDLFVFMEMFVGTGSGEQICPCPP